MAFQMNSLSTKVLREVLSGFIIMEPNRIRCRVRERRSPECIGFWDEVDLCLGAIEQTNARERERERENQKSTNNNISKYKELKVRMHENA